jgi:hypothetical protein
MPQPWWMTDQYDIDRQLPKEFHELAGPKGVALVQAFADGTSTGGWGLDPASKSGVFGENYRQLKFAERRILRQVEKSGTPFAIVMRSVRMICIDIDGKNGGLVHAKKLGALPPTMAETSKSGDGYHLFYLLPDTWDEKEGYGAVHDRIGIEQGVDIRATGCVFHYPQQRWNTRAIAHLPKYMLDLLQSKQSERAHRAAAIRSTVTNGDELEIMLMHDDLKTQLARPIPAGKRNNTLFAIGQQMKTAKVDDWENLILARADEVGLSADEGQKLVDNIGRYQ